MEKKSKSKFAIIAVVVILLIIGITVYFVQNQKQVNSKYYGTYGCQVEQGDDRTTYHIKFVEPQTTGVVLYSGEYWSTSTRVSLGFHYQIEYTISKRDITIKFNQGNIISGAFDESGNLIIKQIGTQTNLLFRKIT